MKDLYVDFIRHTAGEQVVASWVARRPDGVPKGPFGALYDYAARGKKQGFASITLLRSYTRLMAKDATQQQMEKFISGVTASDLPLPCGIETGVKEAAHSIRERLVLGPANPYWTYRPSSEKRVPSIDGKTHPESTHWMTQWIDLHLSYYGQTVMRNFATIFKDLKGSWQPAYDSIGPHGSRIDTVGAIGLIQEPGFKLRAVANPNRVYQMALKPLGDGLYSLLERLPWDCTHDQTKAIPHVQKHLSSGKVVHSVDLSSATDYFPLSLQVCVLKTLVHSSNRDYIGLFEYLSRAPWRLGKSTIRWTKGQPLGLYPSFASFALTHGLLLLHLNDGEHRNEFFVLGDDVVILNDRLFVKYVAALKELGCPVSETKSLNSNLMAEFAGKLITKVGVFPQPKWRNLSDDNFLDIIRLLGKRALLLCRPQQRKVAKAMWEIPDFVGGLGFNPRGIPLEDRYFNYLKLLGENDSGEYLMSFDHQLSTFFNAEKPVSGILPRPIWLGDYRTPDLDLRSIALASKYLPTLNKWWRQLGANLYAVIPSKDVLPRVGGEGARQTLLTLLRRKLGL
jgi:hypothetical protein